MGGTVAAGLLLTVCAFMLAFVPRHAGVYGVIAATVACLAAVSLGLVLPVKGAFAGCWISLIVIAMLVYFPKGVQARVWLAPIIAANAGVWSGQVIAVEGSWRDAIEVVPTLLLIVPASLCVACGWTLPVKIVTSWLLAVALLVGSIPYLVVHPGYQPDHME